MAFELTTVGRDSPKAMCGDVRTVFEDCSRIQDHDHTPIRLGCNDWGCNLCHYRRATRESSKASARLNELWKAAYLYGVDLYWPVHIITSPPSADYTKFHSKQGYADINAQNIKYLKSIGVIGGCSVTHRVRGAARVIRAYKAHAVDLVDSWHFHNVGFMPLGVLIKSDAFYASTGWIYKTIPLHSKKGARNVIAYELSHAATTGSSHILRWWGIAGYTSMKIIERELKTIKACKACGADKHRYLEDYHNDQGPAWNIELEREAHLTPAQLARVAALVNQPLNPRSETIIQPEAEKPIS